MQLTRNLAIMGIVPLFVFFLVGCGASSPSLDLTKTKIVSGSESLDSISVIPGPEYEAGWLHRVFFGDHYRDLWTTPVKTQILDLREFAGGLTPVEAGGGYQTKSLRFLGKDGQYYKFRSIDKNPRAVLPLELRETVVGDLAQDHISTSHPCAGLIVDELAGAVGVPRLNAMLVYLPDDERLGQFRERFGGLLGIFELYPETIPNNQGGFLGATKIRNTSKMYEGMEEDSRDRPDPIAFLTARFLDVLVGDWDRHVKQWKWAQVEKDGRKIWLPIPMDRDQAFVRLDGLFPSIAGQSISQFENFSEGVPDIYKVTFSGQYLDRRLLVGVDKETWDSVAAVFISRVTEEVIERAVRRIPPEFYSRDGARIVRLLKSRRDAFRISADAYYKLLADYVDIYLSDKREYVEIRRLNDRQVEVSVWLREKSTGEPNRNQIVFHRVFEPGDTEEIRLYCLGGDDKVVVSGDVESSIVVRIVGGKGDDELIDQSVVRGILWGFLLFIPSSENATYFYDDTGENVFAEGPSCSVNEGKFTGPPGGTFQY